jgi:four helix bundle protein
MESVFEDSSGEYNKEKDFTSLFCWQEARKVKLFFYKEIIPKLPDTEKNNLNIQIRRASVSVTANIAEGYGRLHYQEGIQFYRISRGSIYELKDHLLTCHDLNFISENLLNTGFQLIESTKIKLNGYINFVKKQKNNETKK